MTTTSSNCAPVDGGAAMAANPTFEFVRSLAAELSSGRVELPSFPDVVVRVRRALGDESTTVDQLVRIVGSEPALAARLLKMANSAALNRTGKAVTDLRTAINRMGYNMVRSAAISFAMAQIRKGSKLKAIEEDLKRLWEEATHVAALSYVIAKKQSRINPDEAMLVGLLHGIGKLYILTRAEGHPELFASRETLLEVLRDWHAGIGRAILENWEFPEEMVEAIQQHEDGERDHEGPADLTDVLTVSVVMSSYVSRPDDLELRFQDVTAFRHLGLDADHCRDMLTASADEIAQLRQALGA
ncbi:MAG: HDOD domain-containing protein [Steroidobacteraceae bacterium]